MAEKYNSDKAIAILHPNGDIHDIPAPEDMPMPDFHASLMENYAHDVKQPTAEGALENQNFFKSSAREAYDNVGQGMLPGAESGFTVGRNGEIGPMYTTGPGKSQIRVPIPKDSLAVLHTHPRKNQVGSEMKQDPSPQDIESAKKAKLTIYVVGQDGLYAIDPAGQVTQVFKGTKFLDKKKK